MVETVTDEALREEVRAWLADNWKGLPKRSGGEGAGWTVSPEQKAWMAKVVEARWAVPRWSPEWSGRGLSNAQAKIVEREFAAVGAPGTGQDRTNLWANTLLACGTEALKQKLILPLLRQEVGMCLLYSEPGAGSDLAGIRTRADRQGDHFVVTGQKVWTSGAATADYGMLIARTDWDVPKHKGISFFFMPMKQPGVEVRPLRQITDERHFIEVFITEAIVPADAVNFTLLQEQLHDVLDTLSEREAGVVSMRFGLTDGQPKTLDEIGKVYGVTRERIRQIESKTMSKLRHPSRSQILRDYLE